MNNQAIKDMALSMNVSEADVLMFAQSIANGIERDGAKEAFIKGSDEAQRDLTRAYADDAVRKINNFSATLLTNKEARDAFALDIFHKLKTKGGK